MTVDRLVAVAELIAAIGVIASSVFVGLEVRRNTNQARLQNWASLVDRFITIFSEAQDLEFSEMVARARADYDALSAGENVPSLSRGPSGLAIEQTTYT